jgi:hypothetical protein
MDYGFLVSDAIDYAKDALVGKWVRWLIFILCNLPFALIPFLFDPKKIVSGRVAHWELVPWAWITVLALAGIILMLFISGYMVRIYKGTRPSPDFDNWGSLFIDGVRLAVVHIIWCLPLLILILAAVGLAMAGIVLGPAAGGVMTGLLLAALLVLLLAGIVVFVIVVLYAAMGAIRFSRTGSIREGIRFSKITELIRAIGWGSFILALIILIVLCLIFFGIVFVLSLIPYVGWVLQLVLTPLITLFMARYYTLVYEQGEKPPAIVGLAGNTG